MFPPQTLVSKGPVAERVGFEPTKTVLLECLPYAGLAQAQGKAIMVLTTRRQSARIARVPCRMMTLRSARHGRNGSNRRPVVPLPSAPSAAAGLLMRCKSSSRKSTR